MIPYEDGWAPVDNEPFVCWELDHRARLNDQFVRNRHGVESVRVWVPDHVVCARPSVERS